MRVNLSGIAARDEDKPIYEYFGFAAFCPKDVRDAIANNPKGEELVFEINSIGGSVMAGNEMYSVLRAAEGVRTRAEIQSLAASAASYLSLGCDRVDISPVAQMMVHLPSTVTEGNRNDHFESIQMLDAIRDGILNAYELKCAGKTDRAELRRMMNSSLWLSAQEAVRCGFADGILGDEDGVLAPQDVMNAAGGLPDIAALRTQYRAKTAPGGEPEGMTPTVGPAPKNERKTASTGAEPEAHSPDWRAQARLAIEKNRF